MRRLSGLRLSVAYPGTLGVETDKGQQNTYPLTMDYPAYSYEIMRLRWETGVYEVGAPPPLEDAQMIQGFPVIVTLSGGIPVTQVNYSGAPEPGPGGPVATVTDNGYGVAITLVESGGVPLELYNIDGTPYTGFVNRTLDVAGPELITNGRFTSDITGWTDASSAGGVISYNSGALRTTNTTGTSRGRQSVLVSVGKRYAAAGQNVGTPSVAGNIQVGSTAGGSDYKSQATNPAIAQRIGIAEFVATTTLASFQFVAPIAGSLDWDNATLRELTSSQVIAGTIIVDDFNGDGPVLGRVASNAIPWRLIENSNATQVVPFTSGGKMVVTPNASGATASYPYLDLGTGKATGIHCDLSWTGPGAMAMISAPKTGARLTIANIVANSLHIVFSDTKVDITIYVGGVITTEVVNYGASVTLDGTVYPDVGWFLDGNTLTLKLPDGSTIQRTDTKFAQVAGACAVAEHFYNTPPTGGIANDKVAVRLG